VFGAVQTLAKADGDGLWLLLLAEDAVAVEVNSPSFLETLVLCIFWSPGYSRLITKREVIKKINWFN
jgi:hypothetical protein